MRFLVYADVQATEGHERCFSDPAKPLQRKRVEDFYRMVGEIARDEQVDGILDLGDTTDDRSSIPVPTLDSLLGLLDELPCGREHNFKLIGNHEQFVKSTAIHAGKLFERHFTVIPDREVLRFPTPGRGFQIAFCSYPADEHALNGWLLNQVRGLPPTLLLGHFQVHGCAMASGTALSGIQTRALGWADLVLLGHVHKPQSVTDKIHYVGSPFQQDFGEAGEEKRVGIVDTGTMAVKWITLDGFPEYRVLSATEFFRHDWAVSEDRLKVVLRTPEETTAFYAHPLSHRYEPVYSYAVAPDAGASALAALTSNKDTLMASYLKKRPPGAVNITLSAAEMLEFGQLLSEASQHS